MKGPIRSLLSICLVLAAIAVSSFGQTSSPISKAEKDVRKLERLWLDAYENRDVTAMTAIVADDFTITFPDGTVITKPNVLEGLKRPSTGTTKFLTEKVGSRVYGDTVILIGVVIAEYKQDGKTTVDKSRYTDTYVKRNGKWQVVASHLSNASKE